MILLCGIPSEEPLALAIRAAEEAGVDFRVWNQREAAWSDAELTVAGGRPEGSLVIRGEAIPWEAFSGCYLRTADHRELPEWRVLGRAASLSARALRSEMVHAILEQWVEITECRVASRPSAMASNVSKPYQAQWIRTVGLRVPPTLVTNDVARLKEFSVRHGRVVYKSVSSVRSIVQELDLANDAQLDRLRNLPTQFQAYVPGDNIRVHVAGRKVFPTLIETDAVDYRYASRDGLEVGMRPVRLPSEIAERCVAVARLLQLPLCGIDLKRTPAGEYFCFEVNPSPAYSYYEGHTGQPIARGLIDYLAHGEGEFVQVLE